MDVKDKVAIVTGASMGIGRAAAQKLAARTADALEALTRELKAAGGEAVAVVTDVRDRAQIARMVEQTVNRFGRLDILVNNAGQGMGGFVENANPTISRRSSS